MTSGALRHSFTHHAYDFDIDDPILKEVKRLQRREGRSLGRLVSDLLAQSFADARTAPKSEPQFRWMAKPMVG